MLRRPQSTLILPRLTQTQHPQLLPTLPQKPCRQGGHYHAAKHSVPCTHTHPKATPRAGGQVQLHLLPCRQPPATHEDRRAHGFLPGKINSLKTELTPLQSSSHQYFRVICYQGAPDSSLWSSLPRSLQTQLLPQPETGAYAVRVKCPKPNQFHSLPTSVASHALR